MDEARYKCGTPDRATGDLIRHPWSTPASHLHTTLGSVLSTDVLPTHWVWAGGTAADGRTHSGVRVRCGQLGTHHRSGVASARDVALR